MEWKKVGNDKTVAEVVFRHSGMEKLPEIMQGIECMPAAELIKKHVDSGGRILVAGDYDCDGVCSCSIMRMLLEELGADYAIRLPRRFSEGYGLSMAIVEEAKKTGTSLIVTVDNGIAATEQVKAAKDAGIDVAVTDHHEAPADGVLPEADVVLDPKAVDGQGFRDRCGAGIALAIAQQLLDADASPETAAIIEKMKVIAAIATVADLVPIYGDNWLIVREGLELMRKGRGLTEGISAILNNFPKLLDDLTEEGFAFSIGPLLNAPGRLKDRGSELSVELICEEGRKAEQLALEAFELNEVRKNTVKEAEEGLGISEDGDRGLVVFSPNMPEGLAGLFAGRVAEKCKRPAIVFAESVADPDLYKGSARTWGEFNIKAALDEAAEYLSIIGCPIVKYGGHKEAAGITIRKEWFEMTKLVLESKMETGSVEPVLEYDLVITPDQVPAMLASQGAYAPFGHGNEKPVFLVEGFFCDTVSFMKGVHVKLTQGSVSAVGFHMGELYRKMKCPKAVDIVGTLDWNIWKDRRNPQIQVIDMKVAEKQPEKTAGAKMLLDRLKRR